MQRNIYIVWAFFVALFWLGTADVMAQGSTANNINGYAYVDLGLPSGLKWATCNVGATTPTQYGKYFGWGELESKDIFAPGDSKSYKQLLVTFSGDKKYDVARATWGGSWRMPTKEEFEELKNSCDWEWTVQDGCAGYKVKSKTNGNWIFLPAGGTAEADLHNYIGQCGYYWTASPVDKFYSNVANIIFFGGEIVQMALHPRFYGNSIRPVSGPNAFVDTPRTGKANGHDWVDLGLPSGTKWATCNVGAILPEQPGRHYAWGEIVAKSTYSDATSKINNKEIADYSGDPQYDVARATWGGAWRTPTKAEWDELLRYTEWKYMKYNNRWCVVLTSNINNMKIIIPTTGYREGTSLQSSSGNGHYWTSTPDRLNSAFAYHYGAALGEMSTGGRSYGYAIRAVMK